MNLRITASYAATDGRMPESIDVVWDEFDPDDHPGGADIVDVVDLLMAAPQVRSASYPATSEPGNGPLVAYGDMPAGTSVGMITHLMRAAHDRVLGYGVLIDSVKAGNEVEIAHEMGAAGRIAYRRARETK